MKLSISNIGWENSNDSIVYELMKSLDYKGLEIAPTRIIPEAPYDKIDEIEIWKKHVEQNYGFCVSSMQSIWFGRQEKVFGTQEERQVLLSYTKKAIDFASIIGCKNLVFGCPRNRNVPEGVEKTSAISFFKELGDYAYEKGTIIGMEANPPIYNTNYINDTISALELIRDVNSKGFLLNLDVGTMIENKESAEELKGNVHLINHVHISEPGLKPIEERSLHYELLEVLKNENYDNYISIEMGKQENVAILDEKMRYVKKVFG